MRDKMWKVHIDVREIWEGTVIISWYWILPEEFWTWIGKCLLL